MKDGIEMPEDLFSTIDSVHEKASAIYAAIDEDAIDLATRRKRKVDESVKADASAKKKTV